MIYALLHCTINTITHQKKLKIYIGKGGGGEVESTKNKHGVTGKILRQRQIDLVGQQHIYTVIYI